MSSDPTGVNLKLPRGYEYLFEAHRYKVAYGGRGSTKSWSYARALLTLAYWFPVRVLCVRELQTSIAESVHKLLSDQIQLMGLASHFEVQQQAIYRRPYTSELERGVTTGAEFFFYGIKSNPTKVKSAEGIDICWVEEAEKVSANSWKILIPTIRKPLSEIWVTFNPDEETDPTYQMFVVKPPPDAVVREFNWTENPWFAEPLLSEKNWAYRTDPEMASHVWGGKCRQNASSQIFRGKYVVEEFDIPNYNPYIDSKDYWDGPYFGVDWGFAQDPMIGVKVWIDDQKNAEGKRRLMVEAETGYKFQLPLNDHPRVMLELRDANLHTWRGDNSRPETINHVTNNSNGELRVIAAEKWAGSVEDGIAWLKSFDQIVIHPSCKYGEQEARLYSFKTDRLTGDVLPEVLDKNNHFWDAVRYACEPMIMASADTGVWSKLGRAD